MKPVGNEAVAQVIALHRLGYSHKVIREKLNNSLSPSTIYRVIKKSYKLDSTISTSTSINKRVEEIKKDEVTIMNRQIALIDQALTLPKAEKEGFRNLVISKATLIDKKRLIQGESTEIHEIREKLAGMTNAELIQIIKQEPSQGKTSGEEEVLPQEESRIKGELPLTNTENSEKLIEGR